LVYCGSNQSNREFRPGDIRIFRNALDALPTGTERLMLILHSAGGTVSVARAIAGELRRRAKYLVTTVPFRARSSALLLCLAADEIWATDTTVFGPVDPLLKSKGAGDTADGPRISVEDIRCFREMAEEWFQLKSEESNFRVLSLLSQHFSPIELTAAYRADKYVRKVCRELLGQHFPSATTSERDRICESLIRGWGGHHEVIAMSDLAALGLKVRAIPEAIFPACNRIISDLQAEMDDPLADTCRALVLHRRYIAKYTAPSIDSEAKGKPSDRKVNARAQGAHWLESELTTNARTAE
jgi:hypothetical protein